MRLVVIVVIIVVVSTQALIIEVAVTRLFILGLLWCRSGSRFHSWFSRWGSGLGHWSLRLGWCRSGCLSWRYRRSVRRIIRIVIVIWLSKLVVGIVFGIKTIIFAIVSVLFITLNISVAFVVGIAAEAGVVVFGIAFLDFFGLWLIVFILIEEPINSITNATKKKCAKDNAKD